LRLLVFIVLPASLKDGTGDKKRRRLAGLAHFVKTIPGTPGRKRASGLKDRPPREPRCYGTPLTPLVARKLMASRSQQSSTKATRTRISGQCLAHEDGVNTPQEYPA
jgi:hypothetical protein